MRGQMRVERLRRPLPTVGRWHVAIPVPSACGSRGVRQGCSRYAVGTEPQPQLVVLNAQGRLVVAPAALTAADRIITDGWTR